jgi:succinate-semialdehyde dehydrogenase / glutarate-semialdehyde dehydrogenase
VIDPATGAEIGRLPKATGDDLARALASAARGFEVWHKTSAMDRARCLRQAGTLIRERHEAIARIMTIEQGKPLYESRLEVTSSAEILEWCAEEARRIYGRVVPSRWRTVRQLVLRDPIGPVAAFTAWNFPAILPARKLACSLAAGCSIIIKPDEETPGTALALVQALLDAGLPPDVVNVVFGVPSHISETLIASPVIRKVSFTGSVSVGKHLAKLCANGVKPITLELGGHAPVLVTEHADVPKAVELSVGFKYRNAGQVCISPTRFFVNERIYDEFVDGFSRASESLRIGPGLHEETQMGTLANERRRDAVESLVEEAKAHGARIHTGGRRVGDTGFFYAPTVIGDLPEHARLLKEEPFGPIAIMLKVPDLTTAIEAANSLPYGLASYAFTRDFGEQLQISNDLQAGMIGMNHLALGPRKFPSAASKNRATAPKAAPRVSTAT